MKIDTARFAICVRCRYPFNICSHCDRGNIYCGKICSLIARKKYIQLAGKRYQSSRKGRHNHSRRQRRYCARIRDAKKKVTHHTSKILNIYALLLILIKKKLTQEQTQVKNKDSYCCFCGKSCSDFVRQGFLRKYSGNKKKVLPLWPQAP